MSTSQKPAKGQNMSRDAKKDAIVLAACAHVTFDGWCEAALIRGAEDAGFDAATCKRLLPEGPLEAVVQLKKLADKEMVTALNALDMDSLRVREKILAGIQTRLEFLAPYKEAVRKGFAMLALPQNAALTAQMTAETVDEIWHQAGDQSADYNWYTKRATLGVVYTATVLYWLGDESENHVDTWDFSARRLDDAVKIGPLKTKCLGLLQGLPDRLNRLRNAALRPTV